MAIGKNAEKTKVMLTTIGAILGCSDTAQYTLPTTNSAESYAQNAQSNELDPQSINEKMIGLRAQSANIAIRANELSRQLSELFSIKQSLCEIQTSLFGQCYAHTPLAGGLWKQSAVCRKKVNLLSTRKFYAQLRGARGRFQLILDHTIESNLINPDEETEIKWHSTGSRALRDIKLSDVSIFKIKAVDYDFLHDDEHTFTLKIDDKTLFTQADFLENTRTRKSVLLNTQPLRQLLLSSSCRIDEVEIDQATESAIENAAVPEQVELPKSPSAIPTIENLHEIEDWNLQKIREIRAKSESYLSFAADIARLRHDLRGDLQLGCWANEQIRTVEFQVNGEHLPLSDWNRSLSKAQALAQGEPSKIQIDLGGGLVFFNNDENISPIFRDDGRISEDVRTDLTIGDISSVTIAKKGTSYTSFQNCWSTWGGLGKACEWHNKENSRYKMNSLAILINNETVYRRDNINQTFESNSPVWFEKDLTANQSYRDIMRRRDCPVH